MQGRRLFFPGSKSSLGNRAGLGVHFDLPRIAALAGVKGAGEEDPRVTSRAERRVRWNSDGACK